MYTWAKPYHKYHLKILLYVLHNRTLLVLPTFKTLSTCKHKLSVHQQSRLARREVQNSCHCSLALSSLPFPRHTHTSRALLGLALTWPRAGHSIGSSASSCPCSPQSPAMLSPKPLLQRDLRLRNKEQSIQGHTLSCSQLKCWGKCAQKRLLIVSRKCNEVHLPEEILTSCRGL